MLEGGIVLDLSRILAGPYATQLPADLADVIKVDSPRGDDTRDWGPARFRGDRWGFRGSGGWRADRGSFGRWIGSWGCGPDPGAGPVRGPYR